MDALFGTSMPLAARFFIAFLVVLALIGVAAWLVRRFGANRLGTAARGRQPRLAVIDAASVDGRRRLVLIRRDNTEHLLMIGGPTDVVIEPNIVRASAAREVTREAPREPGRLSMEPPRLAPAPEPSWQPPASEPQPPPVASPRGHRASPAEEPWLPPAEPAPRMRASSDSLTGLAAELSAKLHTPEMSAPPPARIEPPAPPPPPRMAAPPPPEPPPPRTAAPPVTPEPLPPPPPPAQNDHNLAEMAQQLEAALRRAPAPEGRPPVTDPFAMTPPPKPSSQRNGNGAREFKPARPEPKFEPKFESKFEPKFGEKFAPKAEPEAKREPKFEPRAEAKPEPKFEPVLNDKFDAKFDAKPEPRFDFKGEPKPEPAAAGASKSIYDNLEEEMASLLGRPPDKS